MRVVSLVPSLTETLLEAGADVVGRTRYCVHPKEKVAVLSIVGGTKDLDWDKLSALKADLLILDREENLPWMQSESKIPVHVFHAEAIEGMAAEIRKLAACFSGDVTDRLLEIASRWERVCQNSAPTWNWSALPGELRREGPSRNWDQVVYLIWKNPWMSVSSETFIGSVLKKCGAENFLPKFADKYPKFEELNFDPQRTLLLFSSEPYPFGQKWDQLASLPYSKVLVDGESYSWFGTRALRFLEKVLA